ncbi:hypothetical protein HNP46_000303 [Pseudomonas nitritireducens]|uniref:Uncharacterized protein n=1 Tax=Pseudomonas nitroreducens TaxID=46680 RepID=A0A7W7KES0_PSENT|nr:hypothetical protein [Pseudomonas nitritireducens]MBB4861492.1 hypothetical protein [Pseudomonas nitritireducens]
MVKDITLPCKLFVVTSARVRAGQPPLVIEATAMNGRFFVTSKRKTLYSPEDCFLTAKDAEAKVNDLVKRIKDDAEHQLADLKRRLRKARDAASAMAG